MLQLCNKNRHTKTCYTKIKHNFSHDIFQIFGTISIWFVVTELITVSFALGSCCMFIPALFSNQRLRIVYITRVRSLHDPNDAIQSILNYRYYTTLVLTPSPSSLWRSCCKGLFISLTQPPPWLCTV